MVSPILLGCAIFLLSPLITITSGTGTCQSPFSSSERQPPAGNLVLIMDHVHDWDDWSYMKELKYNLCDYIKSKGWNVASYVIVVDRLEYRVDSLCFSMHSPYFEPYHFRHDTINSRWHRPYPEAFLKARELINGTDGPKLIMLVSRTRISCDLYGCSGRYWLCRCPFAGFPERISLRDLHDNYTKLLNDQVEGLRDQNSWVVILGVGWLSFAAQAKWVNVTLVHTVRSYGSVPVYAMWIAHDLTHTIPACHENSTGELNDSSTAVTTSNMTLSSGTKVGVKATPEPITASRGTSMLPSVTNTVTTSTKGHTSTHVHHADWFMIFLGGGFSVVIVLLIIIVILFVIHLKKRRISVEHAGQVRVVNELSAVVEPKQRSSSSTSKDLPESMINDKTKDTFYRLGSSRTGPLSSRSTLAERAAMPSASLQTAKDPTVSHTGRLSSQLPVSRDTGRLSSQLPVSRDTGRLSSQVPVSRDTGRLPSKFPVPHDTGRLSSPLPVSRDTGRLSSQFPASISLPDL